MLLLKGNNLMQGARLVDGVSGTKAFALHLTHQNKTGPLIIVPTQMQTRTTWHVHFRDVLFNTEAKAYRMWRQVRVKTSHRPGPEGQRQNPEIQDESKNCKTMKAVEKNREPDTGNRKEETSHDDTGNDTNISVIGIQRQISLLSLSQETDLTSMTTDNNRLIRRRKKKTMTFL